MEVVTSNEQIIEARRTVLEFIFSERNHFCMFCAQSGDCELQNLAYELQMDHLTVPQSFEEFPTDITNPYMVIDHSRCVLCGRCVRACHEIAGAYVLNFHNRGPRSLIGFDFSEDRDESSCLSCGVCMQVCPTGAIYSRFRSHYAVKGHNKEEWEKVETFCPQCGLMCPTVCTIHDNTILKIEGNLEQNPTRPDRGQLCYLGRFIPLENNGTRLLKPMVRGVNGDWEETEWEAALDLLAGKMNSIASAKGDGVFGLGSSRCSNEELMLFRDLMTNAWSAGSLDSLDGTRYRTISGAWKRNGNSLREASWTQIPECDCLILAGANPYSKQPIISSLIRKSVLENGTRVVVIGEEDHLEPWSTFFFKVNHGDETAFIKALWAEAVASIKPPCHIKNWNAVSEEAKNVNVSALLDKVGLTETGLAAFHEAAAVFAKSINPLVIAGEELAAQEATDSMLALMKLAELKDLMPQDTLRFMTLKPCGNSTGAWNLKLASEKGLGENGAWKAGLLLLGSEDVPEAEALYKLDGVEFLAVISPYFHETLAEKAHVFIPKPLWTEEDGSYTSLDGLTASLKKKVVQPPEGVKETCQTMLELAGRTDFCPGYTSWEELMDTANAEIKLTAVEKT